MARGAYETRQKKEIEAFFCANPDRCLTAEAVFAALGAAVSLTTVYRAVTRLCENGVLRRYAPGIAGEAALYQWNPHGEENLHIRCVDCGRVQRLRCSEAQAFSDHLLGRHGFVLDEGHTVLYGRCARCEAENAKKG